jgi:hypothetical protein
MNGIESKIREKEGKERTGCALWRHSVDRNRMELKVQSINTFNPFQNLADSLKKNSGNLKFPLCLQFFKYHSVTMEKFCHISSTFPFF